MAAVKCLCAPTKRPTYIKLVAGSDNLRLWWNNRILSSRMLTCTTTPIDWLTCLPILKYIDIMWITTDYNHPAPRGNGRGTELLMNNRRGAYPCLLIWLLDWLLWSGTTVQETPLLSPPSFPRPPPSRATP